MHTSTLGIIILAAGEGTRMRSALPKVLHPLCGRPLLGHVLAIADELAAASSVVVLAADTIDQVRARFGLRYGYVVQEQRLGTGHAALQAAHLLHNLVDEVLVLYGDTPLLRAATARRVLELRRTSGALLGLLSFHAHPPTGYGRVVRDADGCVIDLVEERNATPEQRAISEGNSGIMAFHADWFWGALERIPRNPVNGEYYLTDLVAIAVAERGPGAVIALSADDEREAWGVNDRVQLAQTEAALRQRILEEIMCGGVTVIDPTSTYVDVGVTIGNDSILYPGTLLRGTTTIGAGCQIGPYTTITDSAIGDRAAIRYAVIEQADVPAGATIGPFAHMTRETQTEA